MRAIVLTRHGAPHEAFQIQERPTPEPAAGQVRIAAGGIFMFSPETGAN